VNIRTIISPVRVWKIKPQSRKSANAPNQNQAQYEPKKMSKFSAKNRKMLKWVKKCHSSTTFSELSIRSPDTHRHHFDYRFNAESVSAWFRLAEIITISHFATKPKRDVHRATCGRSLKANPSDSVSRPVSVLLTITTRNLKNDLKKFTHSKSFFFGKSDFCG
jgi:hypothetical protein